MKRIASHLCTLLVGMVAVAGHFMLTQWLFGQTVAIIYLGFQLIIAAWIVYELIRALVYDDWKEIIVIAKTFHLDDGYV